jgi:hypothetical protein
MSALCNDEGVFVAVSYDRDADYYSGLVKVYKSTDYTTFTTDTTTATTIQMIDGFVQLITNKDGNIVLGYWTDGTDTIYTRERILGLWQTDKSISRSITGLRLVSTPDTDYLFAEKSGVIYVYYLSNGTWTSLTTVSTGSSVPITAFNTKNNTVILIYQDNSPSTTTKQMEFNGTSYSAEADLITSLTCTGYLVASGSLNERVYLWVFNSYWKPYVLALSEMTGTYPLRIVVETNRGTKIAHSSSDTILETEIFPKSRRMPELGKVQDLAVGIQAYGNASIGSVKYNFFEEN